MLTRASLKNPYAIIAISLIVIILGIVSYQKMVVDIFPEINMPVMAVATFYKGMGPRRWKGRSPCDWSNCFFRPPTSTISSPVPCPVSV